PPAPAGAALCGRLPARRSRGRPPPAPRRTTAAGDGPITTSGGADLSGARTLVAPLDLEGDAFAAPESIELQRGVKAAAMEEVFLTIVGRDEAEAAFVDDLLDASSG